MRWLGALLLFGCESSTFIDCPSFDETTCYDDDACVFLVYADGTEACRNACDALGEENEATCPDGLRCELAVYYDPTTPELEEHLADVCVE
jgi:hypothetical protein